MIELPVILSLVLALQSSPAPEPKTGITEKESIEFAQKIEKGLLDGKVEAFSNALDMDALLEISTRGLDLTTAELKKLSADMNIGEALARQLVPASGFSYRFLGIRTVRSHRGPLFRFWSDDGFGYHLYKLSKSPAGSLRICDLLFFNLGEWQSTVFRKAAIAILLDDPARRSKVGPKEAESTRNLADMRQFARLAREGQTEKALGVFDSLPERVRFDRTAQGVRIVAATKIGGATYLKAEEEFRRLFPDDVGFDLVTLDGFILRKEFDKALQGLDRLDRLVEGDPHLDVFRGHIHLGEDKPGKARETGLRAVKNLPKFQDPYWLMVEVTLAERKFAETVERLLELEKSFSLEIDFSGIDGSAAYAEFVKSPEYRELKKSRAPK